MRFRAIVDLDAASEDEAQRLIRENPALIQVHEVDPPPERFRGVPYIQPINRLDWAWDEYMDRTAGESMYWNGRVPRLPSILQLVSAGLDLVHISMLFDLAITVFEQRMTGGDSVPEQRSGGRHAE